MSLQGGTPVRRVITGHDETGKAIVLFDDNSPHLSPRSASGTASCKIWVTAEHLPDMTGSQDRGAFKMGIAPPENGTVFRIVDFPPVTPEMENQPADAMARSMGHDHHAPTKVRPPRHPMMHRTKTIDYAVVLSGEVYMLLDDSEVLFKAGDTLVQQATNHAWVNRGKEICRVAFILIDGAEPVS